MASDTRTISDLHTSNAEFQTWVQAAAAGIVAAGATLIASTGEINPATVTKPGLAQTVAGFQVYKLAGHDGLPDIFFKVEYGTNQQTSGGTGPGVWVTVGYAHNGAGTITGNNSGQVQIRNWAGTGYNAAGGSTVSQYAAGGGGDRFTMVPTILGGAADNNRCTLFHIERLHDGTEYLDDGVYFYASGKGAPADGRDQVIPYAGTVPTAGTTTAQHPCLDPGLGGGARTAGTNIAVCAHAPMFGRQLLSSLLVYRSTDIVGAPADFTIDYLGTGRNYRALGAPGPSAGQVSAGANAAACLAIPFH